MGDIYDVTEDGVVRFGNLAADPVTNLVAGRTYFNTTSGKLRVFNGSAWEDVAAGGAAPSLQAVTTVGNITTDNIDLDGSLLRFKDGGVFASIGYGNVFSDNFTFTDDSGGNAAVLRVGALDIDPDGSNDTTFFMGPGHGIHQNNGQVNILLNDLDEIGFGVGFIALSLQGSNDNNIFMGPGHGIHQLNGVVNILISDTDVIAMTNNLIDMTLGSAQSILKMTHFDQATEPTLGNNEIAVWRDSDGGPAYFLLWKPGADSQVKVAFT